MNKRRQKRQSKRVNPVGCKPTFASRFEDLLFDKNISNKRLSEELFLCEASIHDYIHGRSEPNLQMFTEICKYFGVSADWFLGLEDKGVR